MRLFLAIAISPPTAGNSFRNRNSLRPPLLPHYVMQNIVYQNIDVINHVEREVQS